MLGDDGRVALAVVIPHQLIDAFFAENLPSVLRQQFDNVKFFFDKRDQTAIIIEASL